MNINIINNKILIIFLIIISVFIAGCVNYQNGGADRSLIKSDIQYSLIDDKGVQEESKIDGKAIQERKVISSASLTLEVEIVQAAINKITNITLENAGFISSSSISDIGGDRKSGSLTARVPQKNFYSTIEKISELGAEKRRQVSGQDVTEEFVDLGARLDNLKKQEIRLQEILKTANTIKGIY